MTTPISAMAPRRSPRSVVPNDAQTADLEELQALASMRIDHLMRLLVRVGGSLVRQRRFLHDVADTARAADDPTTSRHLAGVGVVEPKRDRFEAVVAVLHEDLHGL